MTSTQTHVRSSLTTTAAASKIQVCVDEMVKIMINESDKLWALIDRKIGEVKGVVAEIIRASGEDFEVKQQERHRRQMANINYP